MMRQVKLPTIRHRQPKEWKLHKMCKLKDMLKIVTERGKASMAIQGFQQSGICYRKHVIKCQIHRTL